MQGQYQEREKTIEKHTLLLNTSMVSEVLALVVVVENMKSEPEAKLKGLHLDLKIRRI